MIGMYYCLGKCQIIPPSLYHTGIDSIGFQLRWGPISLVWEQLFAEKSYRPIRPIHELGENCPNALARSVAMYVERLREVWMDEYRGRCEQHLYSIERFLALWGPSKRYFLRGQLSEWGADRGEVRRKETAIEISKAKELAYLLPAGRNWNLMHGRQLLRVRPNPFHSEYKS